MAVTDGTGQREWLQAALVDDPDFLRGIVERTLQTILEEELSAHLGAERYERTEGRRGYRNGSKPRTLTTRVGTLELAVPQDRDGTFSTELFARYQRTEQALVLSLMEMYVQGVSTRKVAAITEALCGTRFSKSQVSALAGRLDPELAAWRERPLTAPSYPYVWVDARYEHVRVDGRVVSQGVLLVTGLRGDDGRRELLGVAVADTESEATYHELFRCLKARGLSGVRLVISDDHAGLRSAIVRHFAQGAPGRRLAALPGACHAQPAGTGREGQTIRGSGRAARGVRRPDPHPGARGGPPAGHAVAHQSPAGGRGTGRGAGGLPELPGLPRRAPAAHPHHQRHGAAQSGTQAPHARRAHLPESGRLSAAGDGTGHGAVRRVDQRPALPRREPAHRDPPRAADHARRG
jgi:putative transposase